ncbi:MAG: ATP-binding cassette domain-containing protein [Nitriliruptorales bacterium]
MSTAVRVVGVRKAFGDTVALDDVNLEVAEGSVLALLGPNGAGKTTLVKILATLLAPDAGTAEVFGHDVVAESTLVRQLIGMTGQFAAVDELLSGRENLRMFGRLFHLDRDDAANRVDELLERFGLENAADRLVRTYSGGMRRRLDLASSLLKRPRLLFLDEPTAGLDPRSRRQMWQAIGDLVSQGATLLLTTQDMEEAGELAERIAVIDHGRIIAEGTVDELKHKVGGRVVIVRLGDPGDRDRAVNALVEVGCDEPHEEHDEQLVLPVRRNGVGLVAEATRALDEAEVRVTELVMRPPTLDDVFLELTGRPPDKRDDEAEPGGGA